MSDFLDDNQLLDHIRCNLIDIETEQQKTNELLGQILEELRKPGRISDEYIDQRIGLFLHQVIASVKDHYEIKD